MRSIAATPTGRAAAISKWRAFASLLICTALPTTRDLVCSTVILSVYYQVHTVLGGEHKVE